MILYFQSFKIQSTTLFTSSTLARYSPWSACASVLE